MAGGCSTFINFFSDQTGRVFGRRPRSYETLIQTGLTGLTGFSFQQNLILLIQLILVRQAKPGQSCELKGVHLVNCPFDK